MYFSRRPQTPQQGWEILPGSVHSKSKPGRSTLQSSSSRTPYRLFWSPVVVEVIGAGFDRPSDEDFFSLRFPRIKKIHEDRLAQDAVNFSEYQCLARQSIKNMGELEALRDYDDGHDSTAEPNLCIH
jgi:hypothetical protein